MKSILKFALVLTVSTAGLTSGLVACQSGSASNSDGDPINFKHFIFNEDVGCYEDGIVGGQKVTHENTRSQHVVLLLNLTKEENSKEETVGGCTGALISEKVILTAAHCITRRPHRLLVIFNPSVRCSDGMNKSLVYQTKRAIVHPRGPVDTPDEKLKIEDLSYDLALVELATPAPEPYQPLELWSPEFGAPTEYVQIGYGKRTSLDEGLPELREVSKSPSEVEITTNTVTVQQRNASGICKGDSGGPLLAKQGGTYSIAGVTSAFQSYTSNPRQACENSRAYYGNIQLNREWILNNLRKLN